MDKEQFREKVQAYRRVTGHSQQELAQALGIQRQVLTRKFSALSKAHFTNAEIKQIIKALAEWQAITRRSQAIELLVLMSLPPNSFSNAEWDTPPLAELEQESVALPPGQLPTLPPNLPVPLTGLIGREELIQAAIEKIVQPDLRLLTLVGPGGIGKTRVGLEIGRLLLGKFNQAVYFIDLSHLTEATHFPAHLAQTLGLAITGADGMGEGAEPRPAESWLLELKKYLAKRRLLLIVDNFEHMLPAARFITELAQAVPGLKFVVTSRVTLQIYGEAEIGVPPLSLPELKEPGLRLSEERDQPDVASLFKFEAIELFVARAQAVLPTFRLNRANYLTVARLCILLEGWPLSIELAVSWLKFVPLPYLYKQLSQNKLQTLSNGSRSPYSPTRHQTLRATLEWSYGLLEGASQELFNHLGIFKGSFDLEAVQEVCYDDQAVADLLARLGNLVDHSLLKPVAGVNGQPRFVMLETIREYAIQKLQETGKFEELYARYLSYYLPKFGPN